MKHLEILVEDSSGKEMLQVILSKIIGPSGNICTYRIISYKGIGYIPRNLMGKTNPRKRILLDRLPRLLIAYGKTYIKYKDVSVVVVVDNDKNNCIDFKKELLKLKDACNPHPDTLFRIAVEEMEAWLLGDINAIMKAYPSVKTAILNTYKNDTICRTWELLADAVYHGGIASLKDKPYHVIGSLKHEWARNITPHINVVENRSPSFQCFRKGILKIAGVE